MLPIFESILPIFLLVLLGVALKRSPLINATFWEGMEQCSYYVLFPALLFATMVKADFSDVSGITVSVLAMAAFFVMTILVLALWPALKRLGMTASSFTSLYQTATRWNGFVALAIASKMFGAHGLAVVGMVMAIVIIPINIAAILILLWFLGGKPDYATIAMRIARNPLIISTGLGILVNLSGISIYQPVMVSVDLLSQASLSLGLITVGAGLRVHDALKPSLGVMAAVALKLILFPLLAIAVGLACGLGATNLALLALSASVPTAMNGYVLAKQLGGDTEFYAAAATLQTACAFLTIPAILLLASYVAAG
jgi:malonate transporter and related proteins